MALCCLEFSGHKVSWLGYLFQMSSHFLQGGIMEDELFINSTVYVVRTYENDNTLKKAYCFMNEEIANATHSMFQSKGKATLRISKAKQIMKQSGSNAIYFSDGLPRFYNLIK